MTTTTKTELRAKNASRAWLFGLASLAGGLLWMAIEAAQAFSVPLGTSIAGVVGTLALVGFMGGPLGVLAVRAVGRGWTGRIGKAGAVVAVIGVLSYTAGYSLEEVFNVPVEELGIYYAVGSLFVGLGMLPLGIAAVAARRMAGWKRFAPLSVGVYHVAMVPSQFVFFISPTGTPSFTLFALWGLAWTMLGYAILSEARRKKVIGAYVSG